MRLLDGRAVLVTGGGTGIGRAIAIGMAGEGARVAVAGRTARRLEETASLISSNGGVCEPIPGDAADEGTVDHIVGRTIDAFGRIDILVNNAAVAGEVGDIGSLSLTTWQETLRINLTGPWLCCRAVAPHMIAQRSGKIVMIGSITGKRPLARRTPYAATKMALIGLTRTLAVELGPHDINVNLISPGAIVTERLTSLATGEGRDVADLVHDYSALASLGRIGTPSDVADAAVFLASDRARNITGFDLTVDAGVCFS